MTWILKFLASFWREALIASLLVALTASISLTRKLSVEYQDKEVKWKVQIAQQERSFATQVALAKEREHEARAQYDATLAAVRVEHQAVVEQVKTRAWRNYAALAVLGSGLRRPDAPRVLGLIPPAATPSSAPVSPEGADGATEERMAAEGDSAGAVAGDLPASRAFVESCAYDAGTVMLWQDVARRNNFRFE